MSMQLIILLALLLTAAIVSGALLCRKHARQTANRLYGAWDDIYLLLLKRCEALRKVAQMLRVIMPNEPHITGNFDFLLDKMSQTSDVRTHAAIQNGLLLTLKTAIEWCHQAGSETVGPELRKSVRAVGVVDSNLVALRDRHNRQARFYSIVFCSFPACWLLPSELRGGRSTFQMVLPWWSIDPLAYGAISAEELHKYMADNQVPLILAPSQEGKPGAKRVISVARQDGTTGAPKMRKVV